MPTEAAHDIPAYFAACAAAHAACALFMAGVVWFVQVVHYPLMRRVNPERFAGFMEEHVRRTGWVLAPVTAVEALTGLYLRYEVASMLLTVNLVLLGTAWASTLFVQLPQYRRLMEGHHAETLAKLIRWNLLRTLAWTAHAATALAIVWNTLNH